jgi:hypothetical protein
MSDIAVEASSAASGGIKLRLRVAQARDPCATLPEDRARRGAKLRRVVGLTYPGPIFGKFARLLGGNNP